MNKDFATIKEFDKIKEFAPSDVKVLDILMARATQKDVDFLNTFKADKLLYNFRLTAGISDKKAESSYSGWENTRIGGHTLGHYLAAAAQAVARGFGDAKGSDGVSLGERLSYLVESLSECQNVLRTGFIFGATMADATKPELQFDLIESGSTADTWVPWYTVHKLMNGLVETWKSARIKTALTVAERFGEWIYKRTSRWSPETKTKVLSVEYGGMNDCLYGLYKCAKADGYADSEHFLRAAEAFDEVTLFEAVREWDASFDVRNLGGRATSSLPDVLNNRHANTTIPKFVGAMNRFCTLGDAKYLDYAKAFWDIVVNHHTYITGGNSECEHFGLADVLDAERSNSNCETCNTHNMLKLTRMLFMATGDKKYADYYENTFINAILASVNVETGMTLYFQPMATGLFKTYCNPDVNKNYFWCCTGTGLENFTKLGDSFYFHTDDTLIVNEYASSAVHWAEKGLSLVQETDLPMTEKVTFRVVDSSAKSCDGTVANTGAAFGNFSLALRIPDWIAAPAAVSVNCKMLETVANVCSRSGAATGTADDALSGCWKQNGYIFVSREWKNGDTVELSLPAKIVPYTLPDNPNVFAFKYGPVVLAAELGTEKKYLYQIGIMCDVAGNKYIRGQEMTLTGNYGSTSGLKMLPAETIHVKGGSVADFMCGINNHLRRIPGTLRFVLYDTNLDDEKEPLFFVPYYQITEQRYGIYWLFTDAAGSVHDTTTPEAAHITDQLSDSTLLQSIGVGYGTQTEGGKELFPFMQETGTGTVGNPDELTRYANAGGSFSYMMKVAPNKRNFLVCTLLKADDGKTLRITADGKGSSGKTIASFTLDSRGEYNSCEPSTPCAQSIKSGEKYTRLFEIPQEIVASVTQDMATLRISFSGAPKNGSQHEKTLQSARIAAPLETRCLP